jgi:hypothetical protein
MPRAQLIVRPPLTLRVWPVMYAASSEAKKATALAMSSGAAKRRNGIASGEALAQLGVVAAHRGEQGGVGGAGADDVDSHLVAGHSRAIVLEKAMIAPLAPE